MNELIEKHAVAVATAHLVGLGYKVTDVGSTQSFDLDARRGLDRLKVEVKGTTSSGSHVILTRAEVALHKTAYPNNALAIVHSIELDRTSEPSAATGGALVWQRPWELVDHALEPYAFRYTTGL